MRLCRMTHNISNVANNAVKKTKKNRTSDDPSDLLKIKVWLHLHVTKMENQLMTKEFARFLKNDAGQKKCYGSKTFTRMRGRLFFFVSISVRSSWDVGNTHTRVVEYGYTYVGVQFLNLNNVLYNYSTNTITAFLCSRVIFYLGNSSYVHKMI